MSVGVYRECISKYQGVMSRRFVEGVGSVVSIEGCVSYDQEGTV